jgi:hypothetical protein
MQKSKFDEIVYYTSVLNIFSFLTNEERLAVCFELTPRITNIMKTEIKNILIGLNNTDTDTNNIPEADANKKLQKVEKLHEHNFVWTISTLCNMDKVLNINISNCNIDDSGIKIFCKANLLSLSVLHLENNSISDSSICHFNNESMPVLKSLILARNKLNCIKTLLQLTLKTLKFLDLSYNTNKNYTTIRYMNTGERYRKLKQLNLISCELSKGDISTFTSLIHFQNLEILNLENNKLLDNQSIFILNKKFELEVEFEEEEISSKLESIKINDPILSLKKNIINSLKVKVKILLRENTDRKENNIKINLFRGKINGSITKNKKKYEECLNVKLIVENCYSHPLNDLEDRVIIQECMKNMFPKINK